MALVYNDIRQLPCNLQFIEMPCAVVDVFYGHQDKVKLHTVYMIMNLLEKVIVNER